MQLCAILQFLISLLVVICFTISIVADTFDESFDLDFGNYATRMWYCKFLQALVLTGTLANSVLGIFAVTGKIINTFFVCFNVL